MSMYLLFTIEILEKIAAAPYSAVTDNKPLCVNAEAIENSLKIATEKSMV